MISNKIPKVLVVEDELTARSLLMGYLQEQGWQVDALPGVESVLTQVAQQDYDLIFLDIRLPGGDGLSLCREIRAKFPAGVIFTTAIDDPIERIVGLEAGADAYYSKPLPMREMIAGAKALLRRVDQIKQLSVDNPQANRRQYQFSGWCFDSATQRLSGQTVLSLSHNETVVLRALCDRAGASVKRDDLMRALGKIDWMPFDRTLDVLIGRLRSKLKKIVPDGGNLISAQYGKGYILNAQEI
ncbi:response regulator transcription factor [Gilvimarinus sp. 1_MG-2023]|uniref:response regulator transcription factor n=1 Tax=Gilvimarinus sp. 1_MG-2023 TaxID=3062638 RepID=UPI0026E3B940|nr:response regulator transcription factor [Gilvimarinus sp. 1_MG-2023]MDO6748352.1 response regulator transcription factor [Gilvimarinus sp. 1_MG-2023]